MSMLHRVGEAPLPWSFPAGNSVNSGIPAGKLDGACFKLKLPKCWHMRVGTTHCAVGSRLQTVQGRPELGLLPVKGFPLDWSLLAVAWEGETFVDLAVHQV